MKRPDKKDYSIEPENPYQSGLVECAYIVVLEKYIDHIEQMNSSNDIQKVSVCTDENDCECERKHGGAKNDCIMSKKV